MENEYYDEFVELQETHGVKGQQWFGKRQDLVEKYSWAVPNEEVLEYITEGFDTITEMGAGTGYWAGLLDSRGVKVHAFDKDSEERWHTVHQKKLRYVKHYVQNNPVLMVWPPANDGMAERVLDYRPSHVLYVGEPAGGCTATDEFSTRLNDKYGPVAKIDLPSYDGVNDNFWHYVRKV